VGGWPDDTSIPCCKSVKKVAAPKVCKDSPITIFTSQSKWTCAQYETYQWCKGGVIEQGWTETQKIRFNAEEAVKHCCACGKKVGQAKSGNLKAGDEEDVITAAAVTTTTDNSSTDAEVARTVFGGIIAACCMYLVYIHATRKSAVYNAENSPPQAFDSMPTPAASNNANADNTARKNATISFI